MSREENLLKSLEFLKDIGVKNDSIRAIKHIPAQEGQYCEYPSDINPALAEALKEKGFLKLYRHQHLSWRLLKEGKNIVVVTPTASGKTLCYNLPVLQEILEDPSSRAIYLFPTKALAQDQRAELNETIKRLGEEVRIFTYEEKP
jgi:DEAD/DEAH box helicase domain-containing protein